MSRTRISNRPGATRRGKATNVPPRHETTPQRKLLASAVASCLMAGAPVAFGQSAGSNLRGHVTDDAAPVADTEVVATNVATGAVRRTTTSADGSYVLIGLDPGTWTVRAGALAPEAAGKIHTDLERGFIRAEVAGIDEVIAAGGWDRTKTRTEGKDYRVAVEDVLVIRFSV